MKNGNRKEEFFNHKVEEVEEGKDTLFFPAIPHF
jgi:hypothetical protein